MPQYAKENEWETIPLTPKPCLRQPTAHYNAHDVENTPLNSTRDPRRRPLVSAMPFAPSSASPIRHRHAAKPKANAKRSLIAGNGSSSSSTDASMKSNLAKRELLPAYAYKNAQTGLLEISAMKPPSPSKVSNQGPALYPIAINGGGIGVYRDPREFASNSGKGHSRNYRFANSRRAPIAGHISFPLGKVEEEALHGNFIQQKHGTVAFHDHQPGDIEMGSITPQNQFYNRSSPSAPTPSKSPWKIWEWVHNESVRFKDVQDRRSGDRQFDHNLQTLKDMHSNKVGRLSSAYNEDAFDFVVVLSPKEVYAFWADHLDFRAEQLDVKDDDDWLLNNDQDESPTESEGKDSILEYSTPGTRKRTREVNELDSKTEQVMNSTEKRDERARFSTPAQFRSDRFATVNEEGQRVFNTHKSLFERAVDALTPPRKGEAAKTPVKKQIGNEEDPTPPRSIPSTARRRWGSLAATAHLSQARSRPNLMSPPVKMLRTPSVRRPRGTQLSASGGKNTHDTNIEDESRPGKRKKKDPHVLNIEDIPLEVIPRGIIKRTAGMEQFLAALKRGIVVRRHKPHSDPVFVKILSKDGGDTIELNYVSHEDAMIAFKEQRVRFERRRRNKRNPRPDPLKSVSKRWSTGEPNKQTQEEQEIQKFSLPDFIAAKHYRTALQKHGGGAGKKAAEYATRVANASSIRAGDIIAVHPARHEDYLSKTKAFGTASLRSSKADYYTNHTFSLIIPRRNWVTKAIPGKEMQEIWYKGKAPNSDFRFFDFECATEAEYWVIFRGFLLLHRDAFTGRFAEHRARGFGSNYNKRELESAKNSEKKTGVLPSGSQPGVGEATFRENIQEPSSREGFMNSVAQVLRKFGTREIPQTGNALLPTSIAPPSDYFLGFKSEGTQVWSRLRQAGLETKRIYSLDKKRVMIKIRCPSQRLMDVAEVLRIKLKNQHGHFIDFREDHLSEFLPLESVTTNDGKTLSLFRSSHRQAAIDFMIRSRIRDSGSELGPSTNLGKQIELRAPLHMHASLESLFHTWIPYWHVENWIGRDGKSMVVGRICQAKESSSLSLGNSLSSNGTEGEPSPPDEDTIPSFYKRFVLGAFHQPLDSIEQYYGEKVAFYFAWLQHCSSHLVFLSVLGVIVSICQISSGSWDHPVRPFFAFIIMIWSFVVMVTWRQRSNYLAYYWGTLNLEEEETTRPQFKGQYEVDKITKEWIVVYPAWKRWLKYSISFPLTIIFTGGTLIGILLVHANRDILLAKYFDGESKEDGIDFTFRTSLAVLGNASPIDSVKLDNEKLRDPTFWLVIGGFPALLGLCLPLLNLFLMNFSIILNNFENYRTESEYRNHLILKVFSFRFVCYFSSLYYYSYLTTRTEQAIENGLLRVATSLLVYITVSHWWTILLTIYFPLLLRRWRIYRERLKLKEKLRQIEMLELDFLNKQKTDATSEEDINMRKGLVNKRILLEQAQDSVWEEIMLPAHNSFPEYVQAVIQFAYVTSFSVVLPITPLICLFNHLLSMRLDAYKLCRVRRRPLAQKTGGIGVWEHVLHIVTVLGVITNCSLMAMTNAQFRWIGEKVGNLGLFCIVVIWEHLMLLIKYAMQTSYSKMPECVVDDMRKGKYELTKRRTSNMRAKKTRRSTVGETMIEKDTHKHKLERKTSIRFRDADGMQSLLESPITNNNRGLATIKSYNDSEESPLLELPESASSSYLPRGVSPKKTRTPPRRRSPLIRRSPLRTVQEGSLRGHKVEKKEKTFPRSDTSPRPPIKIDGSRLKVSPRPTMPLTPTRSNKSVTPFKMMPKKPSGPTPRQLHLDEELSPHAKGRDSTAVLKDEISPGPLGMYMHGNHYAITPPMREDVNDDLSNLCLGIEADTSLESLDFFDDENQPISSTKISARNSERINTYAAAEMRIQSRLSGSDEISKPNFIQNRRGRRKGKGRGGQVKQRSDRLLENLETNGVFMT